MLKRLMLALGIALLAAVPAAAKDAFKSDRIAITVEGDGPDVILVPGLTSSPHAWRSSAAALPGYRYHFVQVKGFAGTPVEGNASGDVVHGVAHEVARYAATLKRPAIIGHSMGGTVAMMVAAHHPQDVSKVMVVDQLPFMGAVFGPPGTTAASIRPTADAMLAQMKAATPDARKKQIETMTAGMVANAEARPSVIQSALDSDRDATSRAFHELIVTDLTPELAKVAVPATVLYVTPAGAPFTDAQIDGFYKAAYANLKGVRLVRIPDSAHFIMFDNPTRFGTEMRAFLSGG